LILFEGCPALNDQGMAGRVNAYDTGYIMSFARPPRRDRDSWPLRPGWPGRQASRLIGARPCDLTWWI
jgi:hypothetical protein